MVKLARIIQTSSPAGTKSPIIACQILSSSFQSAEIQTYFTENCIPPSAPHYVDVSSIASTASEFLSLGAPALVMAKHLIEKATSPDVALTSPFISMNVVFSDKLMHILSPLDGRSEVGKFLCIGMNYVDHCKEQGVKVPQVPLVFSKFGSCIVGPGDSIPTYEPSGKSTLTHGGMTPTLDEEPVVTSKLDYEVELGIVIGSIVPRFTSSEDAHKYIGGYTVVHDVSARDLQLEANGGQWLLGKCGDGYAPIGPVITTLDEFLNGDSDDPFAGAGDLRIECRLDQKEGGSMTVQSSSTSNLVFSTPRIVSYLSKFMTLYPGDIIATGTPPGVGCFRKPDPLFLKDGDVIECKIEGIGILRNTVVDQLRLETSTSDAEVIASVETKPTSAQASIVVKGPPSSIDPSRESFPQKFRLIYTVSIVTGAARGIGFGIALRLALEGAVVVALIDMKQDELDVAVSQLEKELRQALGNEDTSFKRVFYGLACDVTKLEQVTHTFRHVANDLSPNNRIDILVQAAGVVGQTSLLSHQVNEENFDSYVDQRKRDLQRMPRLPSIHA
jgi:2-keto-4-pentenoate hydratase/2-oxohepta-3-ene-1,7-dioic acid hydratase in catechol pathway